MTTDYTSLPGLAGVYLEDSYVTAIREGDGNLVFDLDAVLTPSHPAYHPPRRGEQYYYAAASLIFLSPSGVEWIRRSTVHSTDADGLGDLGNIDTFVQSANSYRLVGDWGEVVVRTGVEPKLTVS